MDSSQTLSESVLQHHHKIVQGDSTRFEDFPSLEETYGVLRAVDSNPSLEVAKASELIASQEANQISLEGINPKSLGNFAGENKQWRELFPKPRIANSISHLKFTPPVEVKGRLVVAATSDCFAEGIKKCKDLVIGFFVGKRLSFAAVQTAVRKLWTFRKEVSIKLYGDCAFVFEFLDEEDRNLVLDTGSFYISNKLFSLRPWSQLIEKSISEVKTVPIWIMLYGVPLHMWNNEGLGIIASFLGKPLFADECTVNQSRLAYARVCVEIGVDFAYPSSIPLLLDDKQMEIPVEYQWKAPVCDNCKVFGHNVKNCVKKMKNRWVPKKLCKPAGESKDLEIVNQQLQSAEGEKAAVVSENSELIGTGLHSLEAAIPVVTEIAVMDREATVSSSNNIAVEGDKAAVLGKGEDAHKQQVTKNKDPGKVGSGGSLQKKTAPERTAKRDDPLHHPVGESSSLPAAVSTDAQDAKKPDSSSKLIGAGVESRSNSKQLQEEKDGDWTEVKGRKQTKKVSPKKGNVFMVYSNFKAESRFPIDRKKEDAEFEKKYKNLSEEQKSEKRQERELRRLKMYISGASVSGVDSPGRGLRSQNKKI